jgi:hypothetical protein
MTLSDLESQVLMALGLPYANPGGMIAWQGPFTQAMVDFAINRAYTRLVSDMREIELVTNTITFPTVPSQYGYQIQNVASKTAIGSYASASVTFSGTPQAGQTPSITIDGVYTFTHTVLPTDTISSIIAAFIGLINAGYPVTENGAFLSPVTPALNTATQLQLFAARPGTNGNAITITCTNSGSLVLEPSGATFAGGTAANQPIGMVRRVWYQPLGQLYRLELEPGARLISWEQFNRKTGAGYLLNFSFATNPDYCAITPTRDSIYFYPGPFTSGDLVTVEYSPLITANTSIPPTAWGYLVNAADQPMVPEDCQDAIWMGATAFLMPKAREYEGGRLYAQMYKDEVARNITNYRGDSAGDSLVLRPVEDVLATSGWDAWINT